MPVRDLPGGDLAAVAIVGIAAAWLLGLTEWVRRLESALAHFGTAFLCIHLPLLLALRAGRVETILIALNAAVLVTCLEAIAVRGQGNVLVPLGAWYALQSLLPLQRAEHYGRTAFMALFGLVALLLARLRVLTPTASVGAFLCGYAAFSIGGEAWFRPLAATFVLLAGLTWAVRRQSPDTEPMGLSRLFEAAGIGVGLLLLHGATGARWLFLPYLAAVAGGASLVVATLTHMLGLRAVVWGLLSAAVPPLAAALWPGPPTAGGWLGLVASGCCGAAALWAALWVAPGAARFRCAECGRDGIEPRCCGRPAALVGGRRAWTESRLGLACVALAAVLAMLVAIAVV